MINTLACAFVRSIPPVTRALIIANVAIFGAQILLGDGFVAEGARMVVERVPDAYRPRLVAPPGPGGPTMDELLRPPARSRN